MNKNYCIIGTGVAAVHAAKAIRDHEKKQISMFLEQKRPCHITESNYRKTYIQI